MLAVIAPSHAATFRSGTSALANAGGQLIAVVGRLSADDARALAASRRGNAPAMALLLAVSGWASDGISEDTARTAEILAAAGWRVAVASASTPLAAAWQQLHRPADRPLSVAGFGGRWGPEVMGGDAERPDDGDDRGGLRAGLHRAAAAVQQLPVVRDRVGAVLVVAAPGR